MARMASRMLWTRTPPSLSGGPVVHPQLYPLSLLQCMELGSGSREEEMLSSCADVEDVTFPGRGLGVGFVCVALSDRASVCPKQQHVEGGLSHSLPILSFNIMASSNLLPVPSEAREGRKGPLRVRSKSVGAIKPQPGSLWEAR